MPQPPMVQAQEASLGRNKQVTSRKSMKSMGHVQKLQLKTRTQ